MEAIERLPKNKFLRRFLALQPAPRISEIHGIPNVHKNPWALRPIVPCHSSFITGAVKVLEAHIALYLPSYDWIINSSKEFVSNIEEVKPLSRSDVWLVLADVEHFYTNVNLDLATTRLEAVMKGKRHIKGLLSVDEARRFMTFVNKNTFLSYEDVWYKQVKRLAMGVPSSGAIANLFLGWEEKSWLKGCGGPHLLTYLTYIDDIFCMFKGSKAELDQFLGTMTFCGLKLTFHISRTSCVFLDTVVHKGNPWDAVFTDLYAKPGNTHIYVSWSSAHPPSVKRAFIKAEMICRKVICMREQDYVSSVTEFTKRLKERGYPEVFINVIGGEVDRIPRSLLLAPSDAEDSDEGLLLLPSHYDKIWFNISTKQIDSLFQQGVEELLPRNNPFTNAQIVKSMCRSSNLKDFTDAVHKKVLLAEEEANDEAECR